MLPHQYIEKYLMLCVHVCVEHRKARGEKVRVGQVLNEIVERGLKEYAEERGIILPERKEEGVRV